MFQPTRTVACWALHASDTFGPSTGAPHPLPGRGPSPVLEQPRVPAIHTPSPCGSLLPGLGLLVACGADVTPRPEAEEPANVSPAFAAVQPGLFGTAGALVNAWADIDADGDLDLFIGFGGAPDRLYLNEGGVFRDVADEVGLAGGDPVRAGAWGDMDGDGRPDLAVGVAPGGATVLRLHRNDGGRFRDVTTESGLAMDGGAVRQLVWVDFDGDGDLDLFVAFRDRPNALFRNDGGRFTDVAPELGLDDSRRSVGAVWFDYDRDGWLDVLVGNMDGDANGLFRNTGDGFIDVAEAAGVAWGGRRPGDSGNGTVRPCAADVDGDGLPDLFFANYGTNGLFLNQGDGGFHDVSEAWNIDDESRDDSCAFGDMDHDGRLDLYVNGTVTGGVSHPDRLYRNTGAGFEEVTPGNVASLHASHGVQWADFDGDGALDLAVAGVHEEATHFLLRNLLPGEVARRSLQLVVVDGEGVARFPGSEVRLLEPGTRRILGARWVDAGSGYNSQSSGPVHFGLTTADPVDVEVTLVGGGERRVVVLQEVDPVAGQGRVLILGIAADGTASAVWTGPPATSQ